MNAETYLAIAVWIGQVVTIIGGLCILAGLIYLLAILSNMAQHAVVATYGGWKVLQEFRDWHSNKRSRNNAEGAHGEAK